MVFFLLANIQNVKLFPAIKMYKILFVVVRSTLFVDLLDFVFLLNIFLFEIFSS